MIPAPNKYYMVAEDNLHRLVQRAVNNVIESVPDDGMVVLGPAVADETIALMRDLTKDQR